MATPLRRRNATAETTADDYAPPTRVRARAERKYNREDLDELDSDGIADLADEEHLDEAIAERQDIVDALLKIPAAEPKKDTPMRSQRGRTGLDEFAPDTSSNTREDTAEDEEPAAPRKARGGFSAYKKEAAKSSPFKKHWKPVEKENLVKFLDPGPFDTYGEHSLFKELSAGQRVFICVEADIECPICNVGYDNTRPIALFNVVVCDIDSGRWTLDVMEAGPGLAGKLEAVQRSKLVGSLDRSYFTLRAEPKAGTNFLDYYAEAVSERQVAEVFDVEPLTAEQIVEYDKKKKGDDYVQYPSMALLEKTAKALQQG